MRRTGATLLADEGVDLLTLKRFGAWKSDSVAQGYVANSVDGKRKISDKVQGGKTKFHCVEMLPPAAAGAPAAAAVPMQIGTSVLNISGGNNTITVYMAPQERGSPAV